MTDATLPDGLLRARGLDVARGGVQVLFGVDLDVGRGEVLALLGTNGAGKSTFLKTVSGLLPASAGTIELDRTDVTGMPPEARVRDGIVQVAGGDAVFPTMSVADNLSVGAYLFLRDRSLVQARTDRVLELFPVLRSRMGQRAGSMSGGEQQMLALAKALLLEPRLLIIDELSLGLAPVVVETLLGVIESLRDEGMTMLIVEQSLNVARAFADRAVFMERGEIRFSGPIDEMIDDGDLARAVFLGAG